MAIKKGTSKADTITMGDSDDEVYGFRGNDTLDGGAGNDMLYGGTGADTIYGGDGKDTIYGQGANDELYGGYGNDILDGGAGNDELYGGSGDDTLMGGTGDDTLYASRLGISTLDGGAGNDVMYGDSSGISTYVYGKNSGHDTVKLKSNNSDTLKFTTIKSTQLWVSKDGSDNLVLSVIGTGDRSTYHFSPNSDFTGHSDGVTINVFGQSGHTKIETADGKQLNLSNVDALITAMAHLTPPGAGASSLNAIQTTYIANQMAAAWVPLK